jgi:hypothetical protein
MTYNPDEWEPVDPSQDDNYNYFAAPAPQEPDYYSSAPARQPQQQEQEENNNNNDEWEPVGEGGPTKYYQNFFGPPAQQYQQDRQHDRWWEDLPSQFNQQQQGGPPQALPPLQFSQGPASYDYGNILNPGSDQTDMGKAFSQFNQAGSMPPALPDLKSMTDDQKRDIILNHIRNSGIVSGIAQGDHTLPQGDWNPIDLAGNWLANIGQGFATPVNKTIAEAQAQNQQEKFPLWQAWNTVSSGVKGAAEGAVGAMGEGFKPLGGGVDTFAQSGIPGVSEAAKAVRAGYTGVVEPAFNFLPSVLGSEAAMVNTNNSFNPLDWTYNNDWLQQQYDQHDADTMYQEAYNKALAEGKPENVARDEASIAKLKGFLPWTRAEQGGVQEFAKFPAVAQLAVMLGDPYAKTAARYSIDPAAALALKGAGKLADITGVTKTFNQVSESLKSPQAMQSSFERSADLLNQAVDAIQEQTGDTPYNILQDIAYSPDTPYQLGLPDEVIKHAQYVLDHTDQTEALNAAKGTAATPEAQTAIQAEQPLEKFAQGQAPLFPDQVESQAQPASISPESEWEPVTNIADHVEAFRQPLEEKLTKQYKQQGQPEDTAQVQAVTDAGERLRQVQTPEDLGQFASEHPDVVTDAAETLRQQPDQPVSTPDQAPPLGAAPRGITDFQRDRAAFKVGLTDKLEADFNRQTPRPNLTRGEIRDQVSRQAAYILKDVRTPDQLDQVRQTYGLERPAPARPRPDLPGQEIPTARNTTFKDLSDLHSQAVKRSMDPTLPRPERYAASTEARRLAAEVKTSARGPAPSSEARFNNFGADTTKEFFPKARSRELPDHMQHIKAPTRISPTEDFIRAMKESHGLQVKAMKVTGLSGKPALVRTKPLEQFKTLGKVHNAASNVILGYMSRALLNTMGRALRDPAGNLLKLVAEKIPITDYNKVKARYEKVFGKNMPELSTSVTADQGEAAHATALGKTAKGDPESVLKKLFFLTVNFQNELPAMGLRALSKKVNKMTGGKSAVFENWNDVAEKTEGWIKAHVYRREALKVFDNLVAEKAKAGQLPPDLLDAIKGGNLTADQLTSWVQGKMPPGADLTAAYTGRYSPLNFSENALNFAEKSLQGSSSGFGNTLAETVHSLEDRVSQYNSDREVKIQKALARIKNPKERRLQERTLRANNPPVRLEDVTPSHPIWKEIERDMAQAWDDYYLTHVATEALDPKVRTAVETAARNSLEFAAKDRTLKNLKRLIQLEQDRSAGTYKTEKYQTDYYDQAQARSKEASAQRSQYLLQLEDKFEQGQRLTAQEYSDLQRLRKQIPLREVGQETGAIPERFNPFDGVKADAGAIYKSLIGLEKFKSSRGEEAGGKPLTATHRKLLAEALATGDKAAFDRVKETITRDSTYREGITTESRTFKNYSRANSDRVGNRLDYYWDKWQNRGAAPQVRPDVTLAAKAQLFYDHIYGDKLPDDLPTPDTLQKLANKFSRVAPEQRFTYFNKMMQVDAHIREVTGNTFKLDPDTFHPVRIKDGVSLQELATGKKPARVGEPAPQRPPDVSPLTYKQMHEAIGEHFGPDADKLFLLMEPAERDLAMAELARLMGFPDPADVRVLRQRFDDERTTAETHLEALKSDMWERYDQHTAAREQAQANQQAAQESQRQAQAKADRLAKEIIAARARIMMEAKKAGFKEASRIFFDYKNKNLLDQALGPILPFGFWGRQNFMYLMKYLSAHPYHAMALVNFYQKMEQENNARGIKGPAAASLYLWTNPDGSHVLWNFATVIPFNPVQDNGDLMQIIGPDDMQGYGVVNRNPLAVLMGYDQTNDKGKVIGRSKGILPTFLRVNPIFDTITKTGAWNDFLKGMNLVTDNFGAPDAGEGWKQKQTLGVIPAVPFYQDLGAWTGLTRWLRQQGVIKSDLNPEGFFNELLFGKNAGKPLSKLTQELTRMTQDGTIDKDTGRLAIAGIKDGNWTPAALEALDRIQGQDAARKMATLIGFSSVVTNTPRQQLASKLYGNYGTAADSETAKGHYEKVTDPKTGREIRKYVPGDVQKFFDTTPGADVLFSGNDSGDQIRQNVADDHTRSAMNALYSKKDAGQLTLRQFNTEVDKLKAQNPDYFKSQLESSIAKATGQKPLLPGEEKPDLNKLTSSEKDRPMLELKDDYMRLGGDQFDELTNQYHALLDAGDKKGAAQLLKDHPEYGQTQAERQALLKLHPDFKQWYSDQLVSQGKSPLKSDKQIELDNKLGQYYNIGGDDYDALSKRQAELRAAGRTKEANAIYLSPKFQNVLKAQQQMRRDDPDFDAYLRQKYPNTKALPDENAPAPTGNGTGLTSAGGGASRARYSAPRQLPPISSKASYKPTTNYQRGRAASLPDIETILKPGYYPGQRPSSASSSRIGGTAYQGQAQQGQKQPFTAKVDSRLVQSLPPELRNYRKFTTALLQGKGWQNVILPGQVGGDPNAADFGQDRNLAELAARRAGEKNPAHVFMAFPVNSHWEVWGRPRQQAQAAPSKSYSSSLAGKGSSYKGKGYFPPPMPRALPPMQSLNF